MSLNKSVLGSGFLLAFLLACGGGGGGPMNNGGTQNVAPSITSQPSSATKTVGQPAAFTATASGTPAPTFQWERSADGAAWGSISGATTTSLEFTTAKTDQGAQLRMKANNVAGTATSNPATLTVQWPPTFTTQPANQSVASPAPGLFTIQVDANPSATLQWQTSSDGTQWSDLPGATNASLNTGATTGAMNNFQYRCLAANAVGSAASAAAVLLVNVPTVTLTVSLGAGVTGTPAASAPYPFGTTVPYSFSLLAGFTNLQVLLDGSGVAASGSVTMTAAHTLAVSASPILHSVTFAAGAGGTLSGNTAQTVADGASTTPVTAVPNGGFSFVNWTGSGFTTSTANPLTLVQVTQAYALTANFAALPPSFTLTVSRGTGVSGTPAGGGTFLQGTVVSYAYSAQAGFTNLQVLLDGVSAAASGSITMNADHSLAATAQPVPTNTIEVGQNGLVFTPDSLTVPVGTMVTFHWAASGHSLVIGNPCTPSGQLDTGIQSAGFQITLTPSSAGDINFFCSPHCGSGMRGVIHVTP